MEMREREMEEEVIKRKGQVYWYMPGIPAHGKQRQKDNHKLQGSQDYRGSCRQVRTT